MKKTTGKPLKTKSADVQKEQKIYPIKQSSEMKTLYLLTQDVLKGYDIYDSLIVAATSPLNAKKMAVNSLAKSTWPTNIKDVKHKEIGRATCKLDGIILASFNAG